MASQAGMFAAATPADWDAAIQWAVAADESAASAASANNAINSMHSLAARLSKQRNPPMSAAQWDQMVADKVPYRLATACCKLMERLVGFTNLTNSPASATSSSSSNASGSSRSSSSSSSSSKKHKKKNRSKQTAVAGCGPSAPTLDAQHAAALGQFAAQVLQGFLAAAGQAFRAEVLQHLATAGAPVHPRVAAIGQQIMDSGYVQLLPRLLTFAAEQMQAEVHVGSSSGGGSSSSSSSGDGGRAVPSHADPAVHWDQLVMDTFSSYHVLHLWCNSKGTTTTTPACATAVLRAAATTFRVVHARLEPALQACTDSGRKAAQYSLQLWSAAKFAVRMVLEPFAASEGGTGSQTSGDISGPTLQEYKTALIKCPDTLPCVVINTAAPLISILLLHSPQLPDLSPNRSSTNGNSSGSSRGGHGGGSSRSRSVAASNTAHTTAEGRSRAELASCINAAAAWKLACSQHCKLPPTLQQLLHEVGCSSTTLIAAAAHDAADKLGGATQPTAASFTGLQATLQSMVRIYLAITNALLCGDQQQQQQQQWVKLHVLMPTLLLYAVAHQPAEFAADGQAAAAAYLRGTEAANNALHFGPDGPDWESLHLAVFQDVLPLAMQAGEAVLAAVNSSSSTGGSAPAPAQAALASTSSSGGSGLGAAPLVSADSRTSLRTGADPSVLETICYTLLTLVCGLCLRSQAATATRDSGHNSSSSSGDAESVWGMQHVLTLGRLFEVTLRSWPQLGRLAPLDLPFLMVSLITHGPVLKAATAAMHHREPPPASGGAAAAAAAASSTAVQAHAAGVSSSSNSSSGSSSADIAPELTQFLGVTVSLLKLCSNFDPVSDTEVGRVADFTSRQVSGAVAKMLPGTSFNCPVWTEGGFNPGGPLQTMQWFVSEQQALQGVPWLALLGRALLFTAQLGTRVLQGGEVNPVGAAAVGSLGSYPRQDLVAAVQDNIEFTRQHIARDVKLWLQDDHVQSAWAAAGYDWAGLLKVAQAACAESTAEAEQIAGLRVLGLALCTLAHPYACNNPTCINLSGPQELQLVNGRSCMCGGCRVAHYCSRACQRQHWKVHKPVCQAIAAAQAAKAAGGGQ